MLYFSSVLLENVKTVKIVLLILFKRQEGIADTFELIFWTETLVKYFKFQTFSTKAAQKSFLSIFFY